MFRTKTMETQGNQESIEEIFCLWQIILKIFEYVPN